MLLTVCPLCCPGSTPFAVEYFKQCSLADHTLPSCPEPVWQKRGPNCRQWRHISCRQRGGRPTSNHGQTMAECFNLGICHYCMSWISLYHGLLLSFQFEDATKEALYEILKGSIDENDESLQEIQIILKSQANITSLRNLKVIMRSPRLLLLSACYCISFKLSPTVSVCKLSPTVSVCKLSPTVSVCTLTTIVSVCKSRKTVS